ncbi:MAG: SUMF1/EgtB/PvdO family nonheme iron enzyme [Acidobacteriota bacterium]|nr:SUMF1/EgtB/PvdO family nonheme iron enzyme [Acidobacteriota bacterium]
MSTAAPVDAKVDFAKDVAPILELQCAGCHNAGKAAGGLAITSRQVLIAKKAVVPGEPESSSIYTSTTRGTMPPGGRRLPAGQLAVLKNWITEGAEWPATIALKAPVTNSVDEHEIVRELRARIEAHQKSNARGAYKVTIPNTTISYDLSPIPAGDFTMGSPGSGPQHKPDEQPTHKVHVDGFWMQSREVTWDEYRLFMFANQAGETGHKDEVVDGVSRPTRPYVEMSFGMGINGYPAISMTQHAANKYAEWLSAKTGEFYRLPTEAEWEYACRAGSTTPFYFGADAARLADYAWYSANSKGQYQNVGTKKPNAWGLYDMLGNAMEWTLDAYEPYHAGEQTNPWVKSRAPYPQVARGGSWNDPAEMLRCAARVPSDASWKQQDPQLPKSIWYLTDAQWLGFRLVRPVKIPSAEAMFGYWNNGVEHDEQ